MNEILQKKRDGEHVAQLSNAWPFLEGLTSRTAFVHHSKWSVFKHQAKYPLWSSLFNL